MTNQELYRAIGEAEDAFLLECEAQPVRRVPRRFGIIAAVVALMFTACAAPVIMETFDKVRSGDRSKHGYDYIVYEYDQPSKTPSRTYYRSSSAEIEVSVNEDAPNTIDTQYIPLQLLEYCSLEEYEKTDTVLSLTLSTNVPQIGRVSCVLYRQYVLPKDGAVTVPDILGFIEWEKSTKIYGDVTALEFASQTHYLETMDGEHINFKGTPVPTITTKIIFWSDGNYLYCLKFPITNKLTTSTIEGIVTSLTATEDLSEYLTSAE